MNFKLSLAPNCACSICAELNSQEDNRLARVLAQDKIISAIAHRTDNFAMIPSIGALVSGHSLIVPLTHQPNVALYAQETGAIQELSEIINRRTAALRRTSENTFLMFEHGSTSFGRSLCSTEHGHLHILPLKRSAIDKVFEKLRNVAESISFSEIYERASQCEDFIYASEIGDSFNSSSALFLSAKSIPSQYMRQIVAEAVGNKVWNWKIEPAEQLVRATIQAHGFELTLG